MFDMFEGDHEREAGFIAACIWIYEATSYLNANAGTKLGLQGGCAFILNLQS